MEVFPGIAGLINKQMTESNSSQFQRTGAFCYKKNQSSSVCAERVSEPTLHDAGSPQFCFLFFVFFAVRMLIKFKNTSV